MSQIRVLVLAACVASCSSAPERDSEATAPLDTGPVALGRPGGGASATVLTGSVDSRELALAIERYRVTKRRPGGDVVAAGADLNADGTVEALALFSGDGWCSGGGCSLVVFQKGSYGYKAVSQTADVRLPVGIGIGQSSGWRDVVSATGDGSWRRMAFGGEGYGPLGDSDAGPVQELTLSPLPMAPQAANRAP